MLTDNLGLHTLWTALKSSTLVISIALLLAALSIVVYRLTLHPLAKYPGPFLAKITDLDYLYQAWTKKRHDNTLKRHEKYGPVYRSGPNRLSFNTAKALHDIYSHKANVAKAEFYDSFSGGLSTFATRNVDLHDRKKKAMSPVFSDRSLKSMEGHFVDCIQEFCNMARKAASNKEALNMGNLTSYLTYDVMGNVVFGKSMNMIGGENRFTVDFLADSGFLAHLSGSSPFLRRLGFFNYALPGIAARRNGFLEYSKKQVGERIARGSSTDKDVFHHLLGAKDAETGQGFSMPELSMEAYNLIVAGSDTTSTVLSGLFFYLGHNPEVLALVQNEIRTAFAEDGVVGIKMGPKLNSCVYLRACIEEALRMTPSVPGTLPRIVLPGGQTVDGHYIPAGMEVCSGAWLLHHNPEYFPNPWKFAPERWIVKGGNNDSGLVEGRSKEQVEKAQNAFCAFSLGPRGCIGKNMAYMEMSLAMARLLFLFDFKVASSLGEDKVHPGSFRLGDWFIAEKDGPMLEFVERDL